MGRAGRPGRSRRFPGSYFDLAALYVKTSAGIEIHDHLVFAAQPSDATSLGPALGIAVDYLPIHGIDFEIGFELRAPRRFRSSCKQDADSALEARPALNTGRVDRFHAEVTP